MISSIAKLDAELCAIKHARTAQEWADLEVHVASPEFAARAAVVKADTIAALTRCQNVKLDAIAAALDLPRDAAAVWLTAEVVRPFSKGGAAS